jgi:hypothetical protein
VSPWTDQHSPMHRNCGLQYNTSPRTRYYLHFFLRARKTGSNSLLSLDAVMHSPCGVACLCLSQRSQYSMPRLYLAYPRAFLVLALNHIAVNLFTTRDLHASAPDEVQHSTIPHASLCPPAVECLLARPSCLGLPVNWFTPGTRVLLLPTRYSIPHARPCPPAPGACRCASIM